MTSMLAADAAAKLGAKLLVMDDFRDADMKLSTTQRSLDESLR